MLEALKNIDKELLLYLNSLNSPFFDSVMIKVTDRWFWIPFYVAIIAYIIWKYKWQSLYIISFIAFLAISADQISSSIFKPLFERLRPCHEESLGQVLRTIHGCGGRYGFVSSHAANTFAFATFLVLLLKKTSRWVWLMFLWAFLVSYSRVYLGVHYPGDIIAGGILGVALGVLFYWLYIQFSYRFTPGSKNYY